MRTSNAYLTHVVGYIKGGRFVERRQSRRHHETALPLPNSACTSATGDPEDDDDDYDPDLSVTGNHRHLPGPPEKVIPRRTRIQNRRYEETPLPMPSTLVVNRKSKEVRKRMLKNIRQRVRHREEPLDLPSTMLTSK